ncbi:DUF3716 domain-containing protein [Aspergillus fijiensis CBS 313.89]|uniref:Uncharacterized protein n=1 Tax=Aspergillus fijiensis CBS 313.89 TaxID=1448319 RepID=A0A8G1RJY6_9EURO|nr:uncharacterized protein BO72DRAFT_450536 [Aspergillus fijiensis CBS 313.89]RAK74649.1 hypothetical protein BO72DRAFT_450536 [Aspergillus fijiensis CBS 313.89]
MSSYTRPPSHSAIQAIFERIDANSAAGRSPILYEDEIRRHIGARVRGVGERLLRMEGADVEFRSGCITARNIGDRPIIEAILIQSRGVPPVQPCNCCRNNRSQRTFPMCLHVPDPLTFQGICGNCKASGRPSRNCDAMSSFFEMEQHQAHMVQTLQGPADEGNASQLPNGLPNGLPDGGSQSDY